MSSFTCQLHKYLLSIYHVQELCKTLHIQQYMTNMACRLPPLTVIGSCEKGWDGTAPSLHGSRRGTSQIKTKRQWAIALIPNTQAVRNLCPGYGWIWQKKGQPETVQSWHSQWDRQSNSCFGYQWNTLLQSPLAQTYSQINNWLQW
jgi:hypothetical protein